MSNRRRFAPPKIALVDIETAPNLGYVWGKWEQNVIDFRKHWFVLSFAYKWLGKRKIKTHALPDYPRFKSNREDDKGLIKDLWEVFDEADIIVAHNGDAFDIKKANARFVAHGLMPPSLYKSIDTLKIARRNFKFDSNRLDDLGGYLKVGRKLPHTGKHLWFGCMNGDRQSWSIMRKYNAQDVALLERVYLKLRPWSKTHPDLSVFTRNYICPTCQSPDIIGNGFTMTKTGRRRRLRCNSCGAGHSSHLHVKEI